MAHKGEKQTQSDQTYESLLVMGNTDQVKVKGKKPKPFDTLTVSQLRMSVMAEWFTYWEN